jgi:hypothetical protein
MLYFKNKEGEPFALDESIGKEVLEKQIEKFKLVKISENDFEQLIMPIMQELKTSKKAEVKNSYIEEETKSVGVFDVFWQGGYSSTLKLDGAKRIAEEAQQSTVVFFDADNLPHELTIEEATQVIVALGAKYQEDFAKYQGLKVAIEKATTQEELDAIAW